MAQAIQQPSAPDSRPPQPKCDRDSLKRPICIEPPCRPSWSLIMWAAHTGHLLHRPPLGPARQGQRWLDRRRRVTTSRATPARTTAPAVPAISGVEPEAPVSASGGAEM